MELVTFSAAALICASVPVRPFTNPAPVSRPICAKTFDGDEIPRRLLAPSTAPETTPFAAETSAPAMDLTPLIMPWMTLRPAL